MPLRSMRVGVPLSELRYELLAETFQSLTPSQTTSSTPFYNYQLQRVQREQWNDIEWPHLTIYHDMPMVAGQRYYDYPPELPFDSIFRIWWPQGVTWVPLGLRHQSADLRRDGRRAGAGVAASALAQLRPI